jgi:hypothetical protein
MNAVCAYPLIPAKAGIQFSGYMTWLSWIPASAGMSGVVWGA